jgi:probable phosphoglycerate mutase
VKNTVYIARHGQTAWNVQKRIQGESNSPLTVKGLRQRRALYLSLKDKNIDKIYTSALTRAIETAAPIAYDLGITPTADAALNELSFGLLEGELIDKKDPWAEEIWNWWLQDPFNQRIPGGGESYQDLKNRIESFFSQYQESWNNLTVLIVGHACINRLIVGHLAGLPLEESIKIDQNNDTIYRVDIPQNGSGKVFRIRTAPDGNSEENWQLGFQPETNLDVAHHLNIAKNRDSG